MLAEGVARFAVLDALLEVGSDGASREHLVRKASVSQTTFYKVIKPLLAAGLVREEGSRYVMPIEHPYNFRYKCWRDFDRLYDLDERDRSAVLMVLNDASRELGDRLRCLWLVGSAAQGKLRSASDLDFLALVEDSTAHYQPRAHRPVQWVPLEPSALAQKLEHGDEFAVNAIRYGLLLLDRDAARPFYAMPLRAPSWHFFRQKALTIETLRNRFFGALDAGDEEEARGHLDSLAQSMARFVMQRLGESPAGKDDLRRALVAYFGDPLAEQFFPDPGERPGKREWVALHRRLSDHYSRFIENAEHLEQVSKGLLHGQPAEFEAVASEALTEILGADALTHPREVDRGRGDLWVQLPRHPDLVVEMKSVTGPAHYLHLAQILDQVARYVEGTGKPARGCLLINPLRDVPVLERTPLPERVLREADELSVRILTAERLVQAHNILHMEQDPDKARAWLQLPKLGDRKEPPELRTAVLELEHRLYHQLLRQIAARGWLDQLHQLLRPTLQESIEKLYWKSGQTIPDGVKSTLEKFLKVRNQVAHGERMRTTRLLRALDLGLDVLQALESFPCGVYKVLEPAVELFADAQGTIPRKDGHGVLLEVSGADVHSVRIYPTTRAYEVGQVLSWEWSAGRSYGETWYRSPDDGSLNYAWTSSMEFVGRPLGELDQVPVDERDPDRVMELLSVTPTLYQPFLAAREGGTGS